MHVGPEGVAVDVDQTGLVDRAFPPARTAGTANYHLRAGDKVRMWSSFAGRLADVEVTARAVLDEEHLEAQASVPRATPEQLRSLLPDHPLTEPIAARVAVNGHLPQLDVVASASADPAGPAAAASPSQGGPTWRGPCGSTRRCRRATVDPRLLGVRLPPGWRAAARRRRAPALVRPARRRQADGRGACPGRAHPAARRARLTHAAALPRVAPARIHAAAAKPRAGARLRARRTRRP